MLHTNRIRDEFRKNIVLRNEMEIFQDFLHWHLQQTKSMHTIHIIMQSTHLKSLISILGEVDLEMN